MRRGEPLAYNQLLYKRLPFDPAKDFELITNVFFNTQALVVNASLNVSTVDELVALSKAKAGTLSYTAPALPFSVYREKLKRERGADWVSIPFRGGGDTTNAVLSGSTPIAFLGMQNFISHLQAGTMRGLAVDGKERSPLFPDIPTLAELGYRGNLTRVYFGLVAPTGTPKAIVEKIRAAFARPFPLQNGPGGAFTLGARPGAERPPDAYPLCIIPGEPLVFTQFLFKSLAFDPENGFEPVTQLFFITQPLVVSTSLGVKTLPELIALSKAKPRTLSYSTAAVPLGVFIERLKKDTRADLVRVPFRGA